MFKEYLGSEEVKVCDRVSCDFFIKSTADILFVGAAGGVLRFDIGT